MPYALIILSTIATGAIGSLFTTDALTSWYLTINLPSWTPSGGVIGIVWTILYILIAIAGILAWNSVKKKDRRRVFTLFGLQLILNALWSYLFFSAHQIGAAFVEMLGLELAIITLIVAVKKYSTTAAWLLLPYALWVAFATYLTFSVWRLN